MLHGRDTERSVLAALLDEAWAGRSGSLVVRGEAGVGKSTLLADAAGRAEGMRVLRTEGIEAESELPFSALHQLLRPVMGLADRLPAPQARALRVAFGVQDGGSGDRFLVSVATLSLLAEAAESEPVLCVVDDAHWLDDASAKALVFVARRLMAERLAMLFAVRDGGGGGSFDPPGLRQLRLDGLAGAAARGLLTDSAGRAVSPGVADGLVASTGGNPLALTELAAVLTPAELSGQEPLRASLPLTEGVERAFLDRVRRLPEPAQTLLLVAAADGVGQLATIQAAAVALGAGTEALEAAERSGLVRVRDSYLQFQHPLVRSSVYGAATTNLRQQAHRALAGALDGSGEHDRRTWHRAAATAGPDEDVARELDRVAERAALRGGFDAARAALERAAELTDGSEPRARRRWAAAANARLAGQHDHAARLLALARSETCDPLLRADIDLLRGAVELVAGSADAATQILTAAAQEIMATDSGRALHLLVIGGQAASLASDHHAGVEIGRLAGRLPSTDTPREQFFADLLVGSGHYLGGDLANALDPLRRAIEAADGFDESMQLTWAARAAFYVGDDAAAYRFDARAVALARASGAIGDMLPPLQRLALSQIFLGRWPAATASAGEALRFARETGQENLSSLPLAWLALLAAFRGDQTALNSYAADAEAVLVHHPMAVAADVLEWARAVSEAADGRRAAALRRFATVTNPAVALMASLDRVETAAVEGDRAAAIGWLRPLENFAALTAAPWAAGRAAHCRALLARADAAERHFEEGLTPHEQAQRPFERARTHLAYGDFLRRARRRRDSRVHLRAALTTFEDLGARPWADRAHQELRASGETARKRNPTTLLQLTPQELQVARFVAQGLHNREVAAQLFLSPRTIEYHLRNVFTKAGVSSRAELAHLQLD